MAVKIIETLELVDAIAAARQDRGESLRVAGDQLGVSAQTLNNWERGLVVPNMTADLQAAAMRYLGLGPREVLDLYGLQTGAYDSRPLTAAYTPAAA